MILRVLVGAVLFGWLAISLVGQILGRASRLRRLPLAWLIPEWRFFAPEPAVADYDLVYRTRSATGTTSDLRRVEFRQRRWLRSVWNPNGRRQKVLRDVMQALHDICDSLVSPSETVLPDGVIASDPYLILLSFVCQHAAADAGSLVQFGILRVVPGVSEDVVLLSRWHRAETRPVG